MVQATGGHTYKAEVRLRWGSIHLIFDSDNLLAVAISAWKSSPVRSFVQIQQDRDQDRLFQVDGPEKTAQNRCRPVEGGFCWFFPVLRLVKTG